MRAVIAEDSLLLRVGLVKVLEMAGFEVAAEVGDAEGLLAAVEEHRPGLPWSMSACHPASPTRACAPR